MKAMTLPASSAEPPPKAITPSCPPAFSASSPASILAATGFGLMPEKTLPGTPSAASSASASLTIGIAASRGSVTSSGRCMPAALAASPSSLIRPAPKRMDVG